MVLKSLKEKAARRLTLAALIWVCGGLASIERYLETLINTRFYVLKMISYPHLYPQFVFDTPVEE